MPNFIWKRKRKYFSIYFKVSKPIQGNKCRKKNKVERILIKKNRKKIYHCLPKVIKTNKQSTNSKCSNLFFDI